MENHQYHSPEKSVPSIEDLGIKKHEAARLEVEQTMESINEYVIVDIFSSIARKAGADDVMQKFVRFKDIRLNSLKDIRFKAKKIDESAHVIDLNSKKEEEPLEREMDGVTLGGYNIATKEIILNPEGILSSFSGDKIKLRTHLLSTLIHEELHAITDQPSEYFYDKAIFRVGYEIQEVSIPSPENGLNEPTVKRTWLAFNEGLTELIRDQIFEEYLRRNKNADRYLLLGEAEAYISERFFVNEIIKKTAELSGVSEDVVFEAFVQAYFSNSSLLKKDIEEALNGIGGTELIESMNLEDKSGSIEAAILERLDSAYSTNNEDEVSKIHSNKRKLIVDKCSSVLRRNIV